MPISDPNDKLALASVFRGGEPAHVPIARALQAAGEWLGIVASAPKPAPTYRWDVYLKYYALQGKSFYALAKGGKSPSAPLTRQELCDWLATSLTSTQVLVPGTAQNWFLTPDEDSVIAVVAWDLTMSYPVAQFGPGNRLQVLVEMDCASSAVEGASVGGGCSSGQCAPRRVGDGYDSPPAYRIQQYNPGIVGGWVDVTGWLSYDRVCAEIGALKDKYRPARSESDPTIPTPSWGPTVRVARSKAGGTISSLVEGPASLSKITCEGMSR